MYVYFHFQSFFDFFYLFHHVAYPLGFFVKFSWLPYFTPKLFSFSCVRLFVCFRAISPSLLGKTFSFFWNVLFSLYCFTLCRYRFNLPSFAITFCYFLKLCCNFFLCCFFIFELTCSKVFPLFAYFRSFLICFSSRSSHAGMEFCSCSLREPQFSCRLILHQHRLVHLIQLCFCWYIC